MNRGLTILAVVAALLAGAWWLSRPSGPGRAPVRVAVLDTGFAEGGHGARVAAVVRSGAPGVPVAEIEVSDSEFFVTPEDFARAVNEALDGGARVLNVSFGIKAPPAGGAGAQAVAAALERVRAEGAILVAAAGTGIGNPFRPGPLSEIVPQSWEDAIVVGTAVDVAGATHPERSENYGWGVDVSLKVPEGSSFAAARVSAALARALASGALGGGAAEARSALRSATVPLPYYWITSPGQAAAPAGGFGILDPEELGTKPLEPRAECRLAVSSDDPPRAVVTFQAPTPVEEVTLVAPRPGCGPAPETEPERPGTAARAKGMAAIAFPRFAPVQGCAVELEVRAGDYSGVASLTPPSGCVFRAR